MSKFGWDLPPGVTDRMIEDNATGGPEGRAAEAFADAFFGEALKLHSSIAILALNEDGLDKLAAWCWQQMGEAYGKGYKQGMDDEAMARADDL